MTAPEFPAGSFEPELKLTPARRIELIREIEAAPAHLRSAVAGLIDTQLNALYRNWSIRQIAQHLADSHVNCYVRFKLTLTEDHPTIKPYFEGRWVELADSKTGDVALPLALLAAVHASWVCVMRAMTEDQFARTFHHPESGATVSLNDAVATYAWHGRHHVGQIRWLREKHGW